jgi:hypothetical protein
MTAYALGCPIAAMTASAAASTAANICITMTSRLRSNLSAAVPATGARNNTAANCEKFTTPTRNGDPVNR